MLSNLEEIARRYFMSKGYLVSENVLFFLPREKEGKKVSRWSDIDILAYKKYEICIVQCKEFLGTTKKEKVVERILSWFDKAEEFVRRENPYRELITENTQIKKILIVNYPNPPGAIEALRENGIKVIEMDEMIRELINSVKEKVEKFKSRKTGATGKELDLVRYFIKTLIDKKII